MLHMLDTDMAGYVIKGGSPVTKEKLSGMLPSMVCVSVITRAELLYGLKRLPPDHRLHTGVRRFFKVVRTLPWEAEAADFYADIRYQLATSGQLLGEMDMMIAAHSLAVGAVLVTNNTRHFERIPGVVLAKWK